MRKRFVLLITLAICFKFNAQYVVNDATELENLKQLPQEKVFLHHTGPVLFSGEYLYYALYCFNAQNNRASAISSVAYVALVNDDKEVVLEQKVKLANGLGQGEFFVNTDVPSGNYKILGYTNWMKNNGVEQVFKDDIVIINPYQADQDKLLTKSDSNEAAPTRPVQVDSSTVLLLFDRSKFSKREKVKFTVRNFKGQLGMGNYSIRVMKKDAMANSNPNNAITYANEYLNTDKKINKQLGDSIFLPEQRGELLFGSITANSNESIEGQTVVVSIPGEEFLLKFANTDAQGNFYSYLRKDYKLPKVVLQVDDMENTFDVHLKSLPKLDISNLDFEQYQLQPEFENRIKTRSVNNQLENQFFIAKPDSVLLGDRIDPFDGGIPETVYLDEFTRFKTFQETLVEILGNAGYRNNSSGPDYIRILQDFEKVTEDYNDYPAIVLIDGVFIPNHEKIKEFDARQIESISLIQDQFQLAGKNYQGIMAVKTFDGDFYEDYASEYGIATEFNKSIPKKNYFTQVYSESDTTFDRIPDYRRLLFWQPHVEVTGNELELEFYTSDISGEFEVIFDGFTTYGKPLYFSKSIFVE